MEFNTSQHGDVTVVRLVGKLDTQTSPDAETKLMALIDGGALKIVINFEELIFISSTGLRVLLLAIKKLKKLDGAMRVCGMNDIVSDVFFISGFINILTTARDEAAALASL
jgi:anti-sigma B factor antagonist